MNLRLAGIELYFDDLDEAKRFYQDLLGLELTGEETGHHAKLDGTTAFVCLERKGVESYPSRDKAVIFFEVSNLQAMVEAVGRHRFAAFGPQDQAGRLLWAVLHDPEGHNVILLQRAALLDDLDHVPQSSARP
jgi:catechol 2,3-dioxygenase-like lactoylglutathione lyase family enzyme